MDTKTEELQTHLPGLHEIYCDTCEKSTPHKIVASHLTKIEFKGDNLESAKQVVRCENCEDVSFRTLCSTRDHHEENSKGEWVYVVHEVRHSNAIGERRQFSSDESTGVFD